MKTKLIKLSETHYIIVDDSEIKEGKIFLSKENIIHTNFGYNYGDRVITHSTQPLEQYEHPAGGYEGIFDKIKPLSLSEVEKLIYGYSVGEMADGFYENYQSRPYAMEKGAWRDGFKAHRKLIKDKNKEVIELLTNITEWSSFKEHPIGKQAQRALDILLPKTEWTVTFDEQNKLKLI